MGRLAPVVQALVVILCLALAALCVCASGLRPGVPDLARLARGGAASVLRRAPLKRPAPSPHVVVDTLNLTHWLRTARRAPAEPLTAELIVDTIDATAPTLKARYPGRVMYVLKDRESQFNDAPARDLYRSAAERNGVYVSVAERYLDPPESGLAPGADAAHSGRGRDDFYMCLLARRYRCAVLTADRLEDFNEFRGSVKPFYVLEYAYWRPTPDREYVRPGSPAYRLLRRPATVRPDELFGVARPGPKNAA